MKQALALALSLTALTTLTACKHTLSRDEKMVAENGAMRFAASADLHFISCSGVDSDGDEYVTCETEEKGLLCGYERDGGCKVK
jgi:hypothetical protein